MSGPLFVRVRGCTIEAVPSVHYRMPFAQAVNAACADPSRTPDAIAVELPDPVVAALRGWFHEMGIGPGSNVRLPCMLALTGQTASPRPGAAGGKSAGGSRIMELLPLSPADSIVEAIRCALELGVPLVGIDPHLEADEFGTSDQPCMCPDPLQALDGLGRYADITGRLIARYTSAADLYREQVMASRLLQLAESCERVLFVCGLAHWASIRRLLEEAAEGSESAAPATRRSAVPVIARAIVHPAIALAYMDASPALVDACERARVPADVTRRRVPLTMAQVEDLHSALVRDVYAARFRGDALDKDGVADFAALPGFEHMLVNDALLQHHRVATAHDVLTAAHLTTSHTFRREAARVLLSRFPFITARDPRFHDLPRLMPAGKPGARHMALFYRDGSRGRQCPMPVGAIPTAAIEQEAMDDWQPAPDPCVRMEPGVAINWPPIDRLVDALCLQAIELGRRHVACPRSEPFAGSLEDGLDIRATIRAHSRGNEIALVRSTPYRARLARRAERTWEPVVLIHELAARPGARLRALAEPLSELLPYAREPLEMEQVQRQRSVAVEQIAFGTIDYGSAKTPVPGGIGAYRWQAVAVFSPCHFTWRGTARFLEENAYQGTPLVSYARPTSAQGQLLTPSHALVRMFAEEHGMLLSLEDWAGSMIRMAMAYARTSVTVVAPDAYEIAPAIRAESARRGVEIRCLPRSLFSAEALAKSACWYAVQPLAGTHCKGFTDEVEREFGERADTNADLLPGWMRACESVVT